MEPVIVVGNGPISPKALKAIDRSSGSVVRINNFELCREAGSRATHWVVSGYRNIEDRPLPCVFVPWTMHCRACLFVHLFRLKCKRPIVFAEDNNHIFTYFPDAGNTWKNWPSTGFALIMWLRANTKIVPRIAGFDGMKTGHYWDPAHKHTHHVTGEAEWAILRQHCIILGEKKQI